MLFQTSKIINFERARSARLALLSPAYDQVTADRDTLTMMMNELLSRERELVDTTEESGSEAGPLHGKEVNKYEKKKLYFCGASYIPVISPMALNKCLQRVF